MHVEAHPATADRQRAGLGERIVALGLDVLMVAMLAAFVGVAAALITDGKVRISESVATAVTCKARPSQAAGLPLPAGFEVADVRLCTRSFVGIVHDRAFIVREKLAAGTDPDEQRQISLPADASGYPTSAFYLDDLVLPLLGLYLLAMEWLRGTTVGKRTVGIIVVSVAGGSVGFAQAVLRTLPRLIVLLATGPTATLRLWPEPGKSSLHLRLVPPQGYAGPWSDVITLLALVFVVSVIIAAARGRRLPHDLFARTDVVRTVDR